MKLQDETPIFIKQKVNFMPSDKILRMCVSSNFIVIAMANNILLRIDMKHPDKPEGSYSLPFHLLIYKWVRNCKSNDYISEIEISKYIGNLRLANMFLDPLGQHLLIATIPKQGDNNSQAEMFYLHRKSTKLKQVFTQLFHAWHTIFVDLFMNFKSYEMLSTMIISNVVIFRLQNFEVTRSQRSAGIMRTHRKLHRARSCLAIPRVSFSRLRLV